MRKMYKVIFEVSVVAYDEEEAEQIAKENHLIIQDDSVKPTSIVLTMNPEIVAIAEDLITTMLRNVSSDVAEQSLKATLFELGYILSPEEIAALYSHCEFMFLTSN